MNTPKSVIRYVHHGTEVSVRADLKGQHRDFCLCWHCAHFTPDDRTANCPIANDLFANCVKHSVVTPVFECPKFEETTAVNPAS